MAAQTHDARQTVDELEQANEQTNNDRVPDMIDPAFETMILTTVSRTLVFTK